MNRLGLYLLVMAFVMSGAACRKKNNPPADTPQKPLQQILPGIWNTISYKAEASVTLSGVEYEVHRKIKSGQISCIVSPSAERLHLEGQGTFETTIRIQGQNLQTSDQQFGYSEQNSAYQIIKFEKDRFEMSRSSSGPSAAPILVLVHRDSDSKITLKFKESENIENLGVIEFSYEYIIEKIE